MIKKADPDDERRLKGRMDPFSNASTGLGSSGGSNGRSMWDMTPVNDMTPRRFGETPTPGRFTDATPFLGSGTPKNRTTNWDSKTPVGFTPGGMGDATPTTIGGGATPTPNQYGLVGLTPEKLQIIRWEKELDERNKPLTDEMLDNMLPREGYIVNILIFLANP